MTTVSNTVVSKAAPLMEYLNKKRQDQRFAKSVEIASTFLFVSFFILAAIRPAIITITGLLGEIKSKEILAKGMKDKIYQVMKAQDSFSAVQEQYLVIDGSLPTESEYNALAVQILGAAQDSNSKIDRISFDLKEQKGNKEAPLPANIKQYLTDYSIHTDFQSGLNFIKAVSSLRRLVDIPQISINFDKNPNSSQIDPNSLVFSIKMKSFFWHEK